ncbi:hypothetical protein HPB51_029004 [Rhipicephalus microplus]|uniref:Uncharacterized protein n=1 Tax=Rhipicephalus microplus TaxID=6941 RepID=A0A9J6CVC6_RHIMP|nr:hypothetical protein HPB51_029004 [Rhipicephalus microplus]
MSSFMRRHFKGYGRICKYFGLLLLRSSRTSESEEQFLSWNKCYLIYSAACMFLCAINEIAYIYELWITVLVHELIFTTHLYVLICAFDSSKIALNATLMLLKARSLQNSFHESHKYEQRVRFVAPKNGLKATNASYLIRFLLLAAFVVNVCTSSYLSIEFVDKLACGPVLGATLKLTLIAGNFVFYVLDAAPFLVIRPCCEVIRLYIEHQHAVLRLIVRSGGNDYIGPERRARLVENVRLNLGAISHIKRSLNETWQHAIVVSGAMVLWASCSGIYLNFVEEFWTVEHVLSITYTVSAVLDFLDIAILSDAMVREHECVQNFRMNFYGKESFLVAETLILGWKLDLGQTPLRGGSPGKSLVPGSSPGAGRMYRQ